MKKHVLFIVAVFLSSFVSGQTTLISPTGDGGFETGATFAANGWTEVNHTLNLWYVGTATYNGGAQSAYISNDAGVTNSYTITTLQVSHFYRDIAFPAGETIIKLTFDWKAQGESTYDYLRVFLVPTTTTPVAGTLLSSGQIGATYYNLQGSYLTTTLILPAATAGSTQRLVFTWRNDGSGGTQPPVAIDNISLVSAAPDPLHGVYSIDNNLPTTNPLLHNGYDNFASFTEAVNFMNLNGISNSVTFNVTAGQTFIETVPVITTTGTSANLITFQRNGPGANPLIISGVGTGSSDAIVTLKGCDYITFDGIDLTDNPNNSSTTTQAEYGYYITNNSATDGAQNNTIKNCKITLQRSNTSTRAIYQYYSTTPTNASGAGSYNKYYNLTIENTYNGIYMYGTSSYPDMGCEIGTTAGGSTVIGAATASDIGGGSSNVYGIYAYYQSGMSIFNTEIRNLSATTTMYGIYTSGWSGTNNIYNNKIHDLANLSPTSTSVVYGIIGALTGTANPVLNIYNNFIYGLTSSYSGAASATRQLRGIYLSNATSAFSYYVSFNSVRMDGSSSPNISNSCFEISSVTGKVYVRDNIFANFTMAQTGVAKHYCWVSSSATSIGGTGSVSDYNDLYVAYTTNGYVGLGSTTDYATLANWSSASPAKDQHSVSTDPQFVSFTDLHAQAVALNGTGTAIATITKDIDGETRGTPPDIGADEFNVTNMVYNSCTATQANFRSIAKPSTNNEILGLQVVVTGSGSPLSATAFTLSTNGTDDLGDITNARLWYTGNNPAFFTGTQFGTTVSAPGATLSFTGTLTLSPGTNYFWLTYDVPTGAIAPHKVDAEFTNVTVAAVVQTPTVSAPAGFRVIRGPLNGIYTIDPAGSGITNYTSFYYAVADLNTLGIAGPVTFNVATGATFNESPLTITTTGTVAYPIIFQKADAGANPVINFTGTAATGEACFRLNGVDYYTFDGLTLQDAGAFMEYGFYLTGASATDGSRYNTVKNCVIDLNRSNTATYAVYFSSSATSASGTNSNNRFLGNTMQDCYNGFYLYGISAYPDDNNEIGNSEVANSILTNLGGGSSSCYGVYVGYQNNLKVHHANLSNLTGTANIYGVYEATGTSNNTAYYDNNFSTFTTSGTSSYVYGYYITVGTTHSLHDNTVYDLVGTNSSDYVYGMYLTAGTDTIYNNTISSLRTTHASGYTVYGLYLSGTNHRVYQNTIYGLSTVNYTVYGMYVSSGTTNQIFRNTIYDVSNPGTSSYIAYGLAVAGGTNNKIHNNFIFDIRAASSTGSPGTRALSVTSGTSDSIMYNTVYLDYVALAATNQSAALYLSTPTTFLKNNIFVNKCDMTAGLRAVAFYKSSSSVTNLDLTCNNNVLYAGIPGPTNLIAYDGTTAYLVIDAYKAWMTPRETVSLSEDPPFLSNVSPYDLHLSTRTETQCESGGATVYGYDNDIDGEIRFGSVGYTGAGSAPDIGADETEGIPLDLVPPSITYTALPDTSETGARTLIVTITDPSGIPQSGDGLPVLYYNINSSTWNGVQAVYNTTTQKFEFTFGETAVRGDIIKYYVVAQDIATTPNVACSPLAGASGFNINPPTVSTPPHTPNYYVITQPICGTFTIDNTIPTGSGNFNNFDDAFIALNSHGICGPVTFNVIAGQSFDRIIPAGAYNYGYAIDTISSVTKPIVFQKYGEGANPVINFTGTSATGDIAIFLYGCDYVTFDGIDISDAGYSSADWVDRGYYLQGPANDNCHHVVITHCNIDMSKDNVNSRGIMTNANAPASSANGNNYNTFSNNTIQDTYNGIYLAGYSSTYPDLDNVITDNTIQSLGHNLSTTIYSLYTTYQNNITVTGNLINSVAGASSIYGHYCYYISGDTNEISGNTITNIIGSSTGSTVYGLYYSPVSTAVANISDNTISGIENGYTVYGLYVGAGQTTTVTNNSISGVKHARSNANTANGLYINGGTTNNLYNNYIYDIRSDSSTTSPGVRGLGLAGGTTANVYHNTVYINYKSKVAGNSSAALYVSTSPATLNMLNNIFVDSCDMTTGTRSVAFYKSSASLANLGVVDNNLYYAGVPGAKNLIFYDGTNTKQTLAEYQAVVTPKDASAVTENPPFESVLPGFYNLHLHASTGSVCEKGGIAVAMVTTDFDGDARNTTYPDLGADEYAGTGLFTCITPAPGNTIASSSNICLGAAVTLTLQNNTSGSGVHYQWQSSSDGVSFANISGAVFSTHTAVPIATTYYRCAVTCLNGPVTTYSNPVQITFPASVVSTTPGTRCGLGTVTLAAAGSAGTLNWYSAQVGGNQLGTGSPWTTPTINTTTSYYVAAELTAPGNVTIGTGTTLTSSTSYPTAFGNRWYQDWSQMVYTADELHAAGLTAGSITAVTFTIGAIGSAADVANYTISMGHISSSTLTGFTTSGLTTCFGPATYTSAVGTNTITFTTPFVWDGSSNILLDIRGTGQNLTYNATTYYTATSGNTVVYAYSSSNNVNYYTSNPSATTSTSRLNVTLAGTTGCPGARTEVVATVTPPPALTITPTQTICNGEILQVRVTSTISEYDTYIWSPVTNLFTDAACTVPYVAGTSATLLYVKSTAAVSTAYTCTANNLTSLCANSATSTITTLPVSTLSSTPEAICVTGSATVSLSPATGYGAAAFQWQVSSDNITFADIPGATATSYETPTLTATRYYKVIIRKSPGGTICSEPVYTMTVNNPQVLGTTPAGRCGTGTVQLAATASLGATLNWYTASTGGALIGTGSPWTTPVISATTSFWVTASIGGSTLYGARPAPTATTTTSASSWGLVFDAYRPFTLQTVDVYSAATGSLVVQLQTSEGSVLQSATVAVTGLGTTTPQAITLDFQIMPGTGYRLLAISSPAMVRESAVGGFPYSLGANGSVTSGYISGTSTTYYYFYNWKMSTGCETGTTEVVASVTPAPALTITGDNTICNGEILPLTVIAGAGSYDSFTWSPLTDLYADAACTTPYTGTNTPTVYVKSTTGVTTAYTCSALNSISGCVNTASATISTLPDASITASPSIICLSGMATLSLYPATGYGAATLQWQDSPDNVTFTDLSGATTTSYSTTAPLTATRYYKVLIRKPAGGAYCNSPTFELTVNNPEVLSTTPGTRCGIGTVQLAATVGTGTTANWYDALAGGNLVGTGSPWTTPEIGATTSYWVAAEKASTNPGAATIGTGTSATTTGSYTPFCTAYRSGKHQFLFTAAELAATGLNPGNITSLALNLATVGSPAMTSFSISMANSSVTALTTTYETGLTEVYSNAAYTPAGIGWQTIYFTTPFAWNGTSNLVVQICFGDNSATGTSTSIYYTSTSPNYYHHYGYQTSGGTGCSMTAPTTANSRNYYRANMQFGGMITSTCTGPRTEVQAAVTPAPALTVTPNPSVCPDVVTPLTVTSTLGDYSIYTWTPVTYLFTDAACTTPYAEGTNASTVYFKSSVTGTTMYSCTGANALPEACRNITTTAVTVNPGVTATATATPPIICSGSNSQLQVLANQAIPVNATDYTFSYLLGTYTAITGGTVLGDTVSDDQVYNNSTAGASAPVTGTGFPIGFSFKFGTQLFDKFAVSNNGYLVLGTGSFTIAHSLSAVLSTSTVAGFANLVSAFDVDLQGQYGSELSYLTTGTPGSQVLTVQWKGYRIYGNRGDNLNFQIKLYEGSNLVKLCYGTNTVITDEVVQVGLRLEDQNNVHARETTSDWSATILGENTATCAVTPTVYPANGATFNFTPPAAVPYTYLWSPTTYIPAGQELTANPTATAVTATTPYSVVVTGNFGCTATANATVTVSGPTVINTQPVTTVKCAGENTTFTVDVTGGNLTYQWRKDLVNIDPLVNPSAATNTLTLNAVTDLDEGSYDVMINSCYPVMYSNAATLTVNPVPTAAASNNTPICSGAALNLTGTTDIGTEYSWTGPNGFTSSLQNPSIPNAPFSARGTYTFTATAAGCSSSATTFAEINATASVTITPASATISPGQIQQLEASQSASYNNGPLVNSPGTGAGGLDESFLYSPLTLYGSNVNYSSNYSMADDFIVTNGTWNVASMEFFSYQTGSTTTSTFTALYVRIWNGNPSVAGSQVIWGDWTTNHMSSTSFTNIYRVDVTGNTSRPIMKLVANTPGLVLSAGTYWVEFAASGSLTSGPWCPPITITGQNVTGNALQRVGTDWQAFNSGTAPNEYNQGMPFILNVMPNTITWAPMATLYSDAAATIAYAGENLTTVWAKPAVTTTYTATATSNNGCVGTDEVTVTVAGGPLTVTGMVTNATGCAGDMNGAIDITPDGGVPPYTYLWSNMATTQDLTGIGGGTYTVVVTDAALATVSDNWIVTEPSELSYLASTTPASCPTSADGAINMTVSGGTPPYTFLWNNAATTEDLTGLNPGSYSVTITDANNCWMPGMFNVGYISEICPHLYLTGTPTEPCYFASSTITTGGTAPFTVPSGYDVTLIAEVKITMLPGTHAVNGSHLQAYISTTNNCQGTKMPGGSIAGVANPDGLSLARFTLFPNPTTGNFTLVQKGDREFGSVKVEVFTINGTRVLTEQMIGEKRHEFRFAELPEGLYFVKVVADDYVETIKLVKTR